MKLTKKIMACFCAAVMILASGTAFAENAFTKGKKGTFYAYVWSETSGADNLYKPFQFVTWSTSNPYEANVNDGMLNAARKMKSYFDSVPDGKRAINPLHSLAPIRNNIENHYWYDKGIAIFKEQMDELFYYYKRFGGKTINNVLCDLEYGCSVWYIENKSLRNKIDIEVLYDEIIADPRYETEIRPSIIDYGITLYEGDDHNELYNMYANRNLYEPNDPRKKDVYLGIRWADERMGMYIDQIYEVYKNHFPDIKFSDYECSLSSQPNYVTTAHGHMYGLFSEPIPMEERTLDDGVGTHSAFQNYCAIRSGLVNNPPPEYPYDKYVSTPFNGILYQLISAQNVVTYLEGTKIQPWVGCWSYDYGGTNPAAATDYYYELVYHLGMANPDPFLFYNYENGNYGLADNLKLSELMHVLDDLAGFEDRKTLITELTPWDSHYILSGMYAGGKNIWRITPDLFVNDMTIEKFQVKDNPLTFQIAEQVVEFPEGSYIYETKEGCSEVGYWVISPAGTKPTETRLANVKQADKPNYVFNGAEDVKARAEAILNGENKKTESKDEITGTVFTKWYKDLFRQITG